MIKTILLAGIFSGFVEPPRTAAPWCYWLWENSHVDAETIAADAADIAETGFGGVLMSDSRGYWDDDDHIVKPAPKMTWGSDEWLDTVAEAVRACAENGLKFTMNIAASGGHLKGQLDVGADNPKFLKCRSYLPGDPFEAPDIPNYRDVAVFAVRTAEPAERSGWANAGDGYYSMEGNVGKREGACDFKVRTVLDVRELPSAADGAALGAGWTILRFGSGTIPGQEVDIDVLDRAAVRRHLDRTVGKVIARVPDLVGADRTFTHVYNVSWEGSMPTWSATFEADFVQIEGYALRPLLPILAGYALAAKPADAFMRDYRHARGVMMCEHLYGTVRAWAHERGMGAYSESGGPWGDRRNPKTFGECDQQLFLSNNDIPQGEFWPDGLRGVNRTCGRANLNGRYLTKGIVSTAHVYGLPIASAESFTHMERHWSVDPAYLKPVGDQALADGINRLVWHTYTSSPKSFGVPGLEFFAGSHINRNVTWHRELPAFVRYLTRCQYLLQRGEPVVDVAVLTGDRAYAGWGNAANGRLRNLLSVEMPVRIPKGYAYDAVNDDALARNPDLLGRYRVVFDARKPENRDRTVPVDGLPPDVETDSDWTWNHRRDGANDIYFVVGEGTAELTFRSQANVVEIWDAVTGAAVPADRQRLSDGRTRVKLTLPQGGSTFVMFLADEERAAKDGAVAKMEEFMKLSGPWQVSFAYHEGVSAPPPASVVLTNLVDFTTRDDLRHFAGTAVYKTSFQLLKPLKPLEPLKLSLGPLPSGLAHVYVNGRDCGTVWCAPWEADVSAAVRNGANELEIRTVNNWYNRLVGDCALPEGKRVTRSALHYWPGPRTWTSPDAQWTYKPTVFSGYCADDPLQPSGLLGPVRLLREAGVWCYRPYECEAWLLQRTRAEADRGILHFGYPGSFLTLTNEPACFYSAKPVAGYEVIPGSPDVPPHRRELPETRQPLSFANGVYDRGTIDIGFVRARADGEPRLFVGESPSEVRASDTNGFEQSTRMIEERPGLWRSEIPLALRYLRFGTPVRDVTFDSQVDWTADPGAPPCGDPRMRRMWTVGVETLRRCTRHFLLDGLKRDRMPWAADLVVALLAEARSFRNAEIVKRELAALGSGDPRKTQVNGILAYSLWWVIGHEVFQRHFGDDAYLRLHYPRICERMDELVGHEDERGFVVKGLGWDFMDWTDSDSGELKSEVTRQVIYFGAVRAAASLAGRMGDTAREVRWREKASRLGQAILAGGMDGTRHARMLAIVFGLVSGETARTYAREIAADTMPPTVTPYMAAFETMALLTGGQPEAARRRFEAVWGRMIDAGCDTYWEGWDDSQMGDDRYRYYSRPFGKSLCHAWSTAPVFLVPWLDGGKRVELLDDPPVVHSMLTRDGRRLVSRMEGTNEVFELVATNALPKGLPPIRPWRIYVVKATHTDIGLHNPQYVQRHGTVKRIEDAMRLVDADRRGDDDPAAYRYVMEGMWFWENHPMDRGEAAAWNVISNYVRRGRIDIGASCAGNHTHVFGPEEIRRSTLTKRRLAEKWGVGTRTMIMADNPGMSWSIVRPYAEAGIANVIFAPNQWNPIPSTLRTMDRGIEGATWNPDARGGGNYIDVSYDSERPMVFRWESYDRSTNLLVWCSTQYGYGLARAGITHRGAKIEEVERKMPTFLDLLERKCPYDIWLACDYGDDEDANSAFADFAAKWNAKWAYPQFVTVGRLDEPFDELRSRFGDRIPTVRGEMTSGWLQHVASAPELLADKLAAERLLTLAEQAWRADPDRNADDGRDIDRAWWYLILNDEHSYGTSGYQGRRVFETWMQHRDWIERADATARRIAGNYGVKRPEPQVVDDGSRIKENEFYRVEVDGKGEILSIYDKELGRNILNGVANRFLYTRDNHRTWADESLLGAKIVRRVSLAKDAKRIDIEDTFEHAADLFNTNRYCRFGYVAFPFAVPGGAFRAQLGGGEVIDPYRDQCGYATDAYVAVRDWCAVENGEFGVALRSWDSMLTEFGEIHPDKTCLAGFPPEGKTAIYPYLFTDWLQMHHPDGESMNFRFRFSIVSYAKGGEPWGVHATGGKTSVAPVELAAANFPEPQNDGWTGLIESPRAGHGEKDGQLYLLWGADLSPAFSHYELYRDGAFVAAVTNEVYAGIPYRVARYEDLGLGTHSTHTYRIRKVMKDGTQGVFSESFSGLTRQAREHSCNGK